MAKKSTRIKPPREVPAGHITNRHFHTALITILLMVTVFFIAVALLTYTLGVSMGKTKQEVKDKKIEVIELQQDGIIKEKIYKSIPDTGDPNFWNKLHKQKP